jgi:hypothetical protein
MRKETTMDANQRSEVNNQTNNGANEKWTPGSQGKTADNGQPLDHTYPEGPGGEHFQHNNTMDHRDMGSGVAETQLSGGSGTVQGITDSHELQMEQKSGAYGMLEMPVGNRPKDGGVNLNAQRTQGGGMAGPQGSLPPHAPGGSMGNRQSGSQSGNYGGTQGGGMAGPHTGAQAGQEAEAGNTQLGVAGSGSMANQNSDYGGVHQSNDAAGGLPRSPGNSGPRKAGDSTDRTGSQTGPGAADIGPGQGQHQSNDASGHYPRSPGYANRLAGDRNMDDDTGFKRK